MAKDFDRVVICLAIMQSYAIIVTLINYIAWIILALSIAFLIPPVLLRLQCYSLVASSGPFCRICSTKLTGSGPLVMLVSQELPIMNLNKSEELEFNYWK